MAKRSWSRGLVLAGLVIMSVSTLVDAVPPSTEPPVEQMLSFKPRMEVDISTPTKDEYAQCEVKLEKGSKPNSAGWVLLDAKKQPVRKFFDTHGTKVPDVWSYYKDGVEVYREIDTNKNGKVDQYRWLNSAGTKWGVDFNEVGKIDAWRAISAEEAAQEVYQAVATRDFSRLKRLFITEEEIVALRLPKAQVAHLRESLAKAQAKFQDLCAKSSNLSSQSQFVRVESVLPQCVPAADAGPERDVIRYPSRAILYQGVDKKHEWLHTGEMILVGQAPRITDAPSVTDVLEQVTEQPRAVDDNLKKHLEDLERLDKNAPPSPTNFDKNPAVVEYNVKRVALVEQIFTQSTDAKDKATWMRQILDNLCTAQQASGSDTKLLAKLANLRDQLAKSAPGSELAGYAHYREMWARFAPQLAGTTGDAAKTQRDWNDELIKFVSAYPKAEDAPDALWQLAMGAEFGGKDKQEEARRYYGLLAANFPDHMFAPKAKGAVKRLEINGKTMDLAGPTLQGGSFNLTKLQGKVVLVYYWSSSCRVCVGDFALMRQMQSAYAAKGLEIVTVNLDETPAEATRFLSANTLQCIHLFQATEQGKGMESPLAIQYGIVAMPTIFLVGKDGHVIERSIQISDLEDAVKKAL